MSKKVLQFKARVGWNRVAGDDLNHFMRRFFPSWPDGHLKAAANYLLVHGEDLGIQLRFSRISRCREESYKPFSQTQRYYREIESEAMFI